MPDPGVRACVLGTAGWPAHLEGSEGGESEWERGQEGPQWLARDWPGGKLEMPIRNLSAALKDSVE